MKVKIRKKVDELFALPPKPGKRKEVEETFPHGGQPYGGSRLQDGDAEHAGHVNRAKAQGRREVMDEIIDEEIDAVLEKFSKKERAKRRKKCDNPKGFTMKQFCKNQRTRSKKGEKKNEELELQERCQKGYKTHPTRKTKKMYGKTYRNCIKAKTKKRKRKNEEKLPPKVFAKAATIEDEGKPPNQALAIAANMYERGDLEERKKKRDPKKGTGKKPKGSGRRLYTDENPKDTVGVKFRTVQDIKDTLSKASFKSKSHKRQSQIINLIHQRARAAYSNAKDPKTKARLKKAYDYAKKRKEASKRKTKRMQKKK